MDELAKKFADLAERYGPSVIDVARAAARMEAYSTLAGSVIALVICGVLLLAGRFLYAKSKDDDWDDDWSVAAFVLYALAIIPACIALWSWIDPWTWTAINQPDMWIAKRVLKL